ncbi:MAG: cytochrome c [Ramlibacter sp.]|nr:cytochrome c [Ramlibacter sp.]
MKAILSLAMAATLTATAAPATAQFAKAEDAVRYRQGALAVLAQHFTRIGAMVRGRTPYDPRVAVENAEMVATMARLPWPAFGPETEKISHSVKPEAWSEPARFREQHEKLAAESVKLVAAARTNNLDNLKAAFASTASTCKSCHDAYRTN